MFLLFPNKLLQWHLSEESCILCKKQHCTLAQILGTCKISLQQDLFIFWHDSVVLKLIDSLKAFMNGIPNKVTLVPHHQKGQLTYQVLFLANDWKVVTDCNKQYLFPIETALTALRPYILVCSPSLRHVIIIELTCPCEENMERWHLVKSKKYEPLGHTI